MNPVAGQLLSSIEKHNRSRQVEASQMLNQAQATRLSASKAAANIGLRAAFHSDRVSQARPMVGILLWPISALRR
jgi:hypothetical protein